MGPLHPGRVPHRRLPLRPHRPHPSVLANYADRLQKKWVDAFHAKDTAGFNLYSTRFITLIEDIDRLLATRRDFLLGPWIASARNWGITPAEKDAYERNARDLITLWGDANSPLHEYANRQWSGLLDDFYKVRWQKFFTLLHQSLRQDKPPTSINSKRRSAHGNGIGSTNTDPTRQPLPVTAGKWPCSFIKNIVNP